MKDFNQVKYNSQLQQRDRETEMQTQNISASRQNWHHKNNSASKTM